MKRKIIVMLLLLLLSGCGKHNLTDVESLTAKAQRNNCVHGASSLTKICVANAGVFYIDNNAAGKLLCYFDYDANSSFVLCSTPECLHSDEECAAFRASSTFVDGFACYDGALYLLQREVDDTTYRLIQMDVNCENQTVLTEITAEEGWSVAAISDVYYCGSYAWIHAIYGKYEDTARQMINAEELLAIRLTDGEIISLTGPLTTEKDNLSYLSFAAISDSAVAWNIDCYDALPLSQNEFLGQNENIENYISYLEQYYENVETIRSWWMVSQEDMEPTQIAFPGNLIIDFYEGKCLGLVLNGDVETELLYNPDTGETQELFSIQNGGCLGRYQGEICNLLYGGENLIFMESQGDSKAQVSSYSLADDSITPLFEDDESISFRIIGETEDRLIGTVGTNTARVWIWKSDYLNGDWSNRVTILPGM